MALDHRAEPVVEVEVLVAVDVPDLRALAPLEVDRPRVAQLVGRGDAAREHLVRALVGLGRAGGRVVEPLLLALDELADALTVDLDWEVDGHASSLPPPPPPRRRRRPRRLRRAGAGAAGHVATVHLRPCTRTPSSTPAKDPVTSAACSAYSRRSRRSPGSPTSRSTRSSTAARSRPASRPLRTATSWPCAIRAWSTRSSTSRSCARSRGRWRSATSATPPPARTRGRTPSPSGAPTGARSRWPTTAT